MVTGCIVIVILRTSGTAFPFQWTNYLFVPPVRGQCRSFPLARDTPFHHRHRYRSTWNWIDRLLKSRSTTTPWRHYRSKDYRPPKYPEGWLTDGQMCLDLVTYAAGCFVEQGSADMAVFEETWNWWRKYDCSLRSNALVWSHVPRWCRLSVRFYYYPREARQGCYWWWVTIWGNYLGMRQMLVDLIASVRHREWIVEYHPQFGAVLKWISHGITQVAVLTHKKSTE